MASHEQQTGQTAETHDESDQTMSSHAAGEAIAIANQETWSSEKTGEIDDSVSDIDNLLDDIERELESETMALNYVQKGGQ